MGIVTSLLCSHLAEANRPKSQRGSKSSRGDMAEEQSCYRAPSKTPLTSSTTPKSARKGTKSVNSVSCGSLNQDDTGTALLGWNMYDAGELSSIIVSDMGRPSCERS